MNTENEEGIFQNISLVENSKCRKTVYQLDHKCAEFELASRALDENPEQRYVDETDCRGC